MFGLRPLNPDIVPVNVVDVSSFRVPTVPGVNAIFAADVPLNSIVPPLMVPATAATLPSMSRSAPSPFDTNVPVVPILLLRMRNSLPLFACSVPEFTAVTPEMMLTPVPATVSIRLPAPIDSLPPVIFALERST